MKDERWTTFSISIKVQINTVSLEASCVSVSGGQESDEQLLGQTVTDLKHSPLII